MCAQLLNRDFSGLFLGLFVSIQNRDNHGFVYFNELLFASMKQAYGENLVKEADVFLKEYISQEEEKTKKRIQEGIKAINERRKERMSRMLTRKSQKSRGANPIYVLLRAGMTLEAWKRFAGSFYEKIQKAKENGEKFSPPESPTSLGENQKEEFKYNVRPAISRDKDRTSFLPRSLFLSSLKKMSRINTVGGDHYLEALMRLQQSTQNHEKPAELNQGVIEEEEEKDESFEGETEKKEEKQERVEESQAESMESSSESNDSELLSTFSSHSSDFQDESSEDLEGENQNKEAQTKRNDSFDSRELSDVDLE